MTPTTDASPFAIAPFADRTLQFGLEFGASLRRPALVASVLLIGTVCATLSQPVLVSWVIDRGVIEKDMNALSLSIFLLLGAVAHEAVLIAGHLILFVWVGERYLARLRNRGFEHLGPAGCAAGDPRVLWRGGAFSLRPSGSQERHLFLYTGDPSPNGH